MEAQIKNMPDPDQPPGHRKLPEEEREKTLNLLLDGNILDSFDLLTKSYIFIQMK